GNARFNWLSDTIDSARSADIPWVIVAMHKVCLSIGRKECGIGPDLMNLLIEKKVDLVLQAHDHNYQRTKQLTTNDSCPEVPTASFKRQCVAGEQSGDVYYHGAGTVFVVAGMGGKELYEVDPQRNVGDYFAAWM